jgi:glutathione S-transferase
MAILVHHLENSRSHRVLWLLEELDVPYELKRYQRNPATRLAPPVLRQVHPLGKSPVIEDEGRAVAETGAIVEYLIDRSGGRLGAPANPEGALCYRYFSHYAEGSLMPPLFTKLVLGRVPLFGKFVQRRFQPMIDVHLDYVEAELGKRPWFAGGEFTAADIMMSYPMEAARERAGLGPARHPHSVAWLKKIQERPAYRAAVERGGPYAFAQQR